VTVTVPRTSRRATMTSALSARRSDPVREIEDLQDRMGQLMDGLFGYTSPTVSMRLSMVPADVEETDDAFVVQLDLPGVKPGEVNLEAREYELRISGEIKERERKGVLRRQMRPFGAFEHVVALPGEIDPNRVEATLTDGVLTVRLSKSQAHQSRRIQVKNS
jgi:HSP20 family protein